MASIDVAIPSYNYGRYLRDCVQSVLSQEGVDLRVLIVDNASTDDSPQIARELAASDSRVELCLRERNLGQHASFNQGVDWAEADYFAILCADDLLPLGALARAVAIMEQNPDVNLVYGRTEFVPSAFSPSTLALPSQPADFRIFSGQEFLEIFCRTGRSPISGPTAIVRTAAQKRAGHYLTSLPHTDDVEMWMRIACLGSVAEIDAVQLYARIHEANQSAAVSNVHSWNLEMEQAFAAFFSGAGAALGQARRLHRMACRSLAHRAYWCAVSHVLRGEPGAPDLMRFALRLRPTLALVPPLGSLFSRADALDRIRATLKARLSARPTDHAEESSALRRKA